MNGLLKRVACLGGVLLLVGCSSLEQRQGGASQGQPVAATEPPRLPFTPPAPPVRELDEDLVFSALAGEIALQRRDFPLAYRYQMQTARLAGDAAAAERAARIALVLKRTELAREAAALWTRLAPNSLGARQLAALLAMNAGQRDEAFRQLQAILAISEAKGEDGYLAAMAALSKAKDHPAALQMLRRLGAAHGDDRRAGYALSLLAMMWKEYPIAEQEIRRLLEQYPDWGRGYFLWSRIRMSQGDQQGAIDILRRAIGRQPDDLDLNAALARLLVESGDYQAAYRQFLRVRRLAPKDPDVVYSLGVLAMQLERVEDARRYFEQLQQRGQRSDDVAYYLGRIAEQDGRLDDALGWYRRVQGGGFKFEAQLMAIRVLARLGRVEEARSELQSLRIQMPEKEVQLYLLEAGILRDFGTRQQVLGLYRKALVAHPDDPELLYARGLYAAEIGRMEMMERDLRKVIAMDPTNADALNALGYTFADQSRRFEEAQSLISRALKLKPDSPAILDSMGWLQYRMGNYEQALVFLQRAYGLDRDSEIAAHLGEVLWMTGDRAGARRIWEQALKRDPDSRYLKETVERLTGSRP
ncbi:MAG TPA: tetratricopeptide repeat protein [Sedimenticola thiotaurini]|uniref:Tetratricopeptide repeat protein n=1 Tax=Sedimenticola thiotaurini TaxID=1543721 RepID=A0A831W5J4_9GAMM|nr:tetratricopeptide repeat protein [Sedimenticola thiotaurini]